MDGRGDEKRALAAQLAQVLAMVRELETRMDQDLPAAARELCGELASSVARSIRIARSVDGTPPGDGSQHPGGGNAQSKRRKGTPCVRRQVRVASVQDMAPLDDGLSWRKYGQKDILGAKYPRAYFRCTHRHSQGCLATKHVQRADGDPLLYDVVYHGAHTCAAQAAHPTAEHLSRQLQLGGHHADATGQEQSSPPEPETEGLQAGLLEPMTPYSFAQAPGAGADFSGGAFPLLSPTGLEWQLRSSHAGSGLGVGMDYEPQFAEFFTNAADPLQWEYQEDYLNLYAAN